MEIVDSIREFGFTNPILVDENDIIIAGHGRLLAAQRLEIGRVPTILLVGLTPEQRTAYALADNRIPLNAGWDEKKLARQLRALVEADFNTALTGFSEREVKAIRQAAERFMGATDENAVPEVEQVVVSRPGDLWVLGNHRLLCGDATDREDVERLLGGVKPHLMVTDPPYGVSYEPGWRNEAMRADGSRFEARAVGRVRNDDRADWRDAWRLFPGEVAYVWHAGVHAMAVGQGLMDSGFEIRAQIVWKKPRHVISRGHYHWQHEPCWYAVRKGGTGHWNGDRSQFTVWDISHAKSETGHGTEKPVEAMRRPMQNNSSEGQAVFDPFLGSGSSIIAAESCRRCCLALEIEPRYADVVVRRWEGFSLGKAVLEGDGRGFEEIACERRVE